MWPSTASASRRGGARPSVRFPGGGGAILTDSTGAIVTVDGVDKAAGALAFSKFVDSGSDVTFAYQSPVASSVSGKRYRWDTTTCAATTQTGTLSNVLSAKSVTGNYVAQYSVSFTAAGGAILTDSTGAIVTVDGVDKAAGALAFSKFV